MHYTTNRNLPPWLSGALRTSGHWHQAFLTIHAIQQSSSKQTANGHRRSSRDEAARFRICQGNKFHIFLAGEITRWDQWTRHWFCSQEYPAGIHHLTCRVKRKNFVTSSTFISGSGHSIKSVPILHFCHPQEKQRTNPMTNWSPPSRESLS